MKRVWLGDTLHRIFVTVEIICTSLYTSFANNFTFSKRIINSKLTVAIFQVQFRDDLDGAHRHRLPADCRRVTPPDICSAALIVIESSSSRHRAGDPRPSRHPASARRLRQMARNDVRNGANDTRPTGWGEQCSVCDITQRECSVTQRGRVICCTA